LENIKKQPLLKIPAKASIWYIASGGVARAIGALSTPIFTRLLTPTEYGLYPLYNTWIGVLSVIVTLELTGSAIYRGFQKYGEQKEQFTTATLGLLGVIFTIFCTLYFAFYGLIGNFTGLSLRVSIFMLVQIFANGIISLYLAKARFEYKYKAVAVLNLASAIVTPFSAVVLILLTDIRAEARIYASAFITLFIAVGVAILILRGSEKLYEKQMWRYMLGRSIPLLPHYFATALILKAGEISIGRNHGTEALGMYSIAVSVGMILTIVTGGLLSALSPWIIRKIREGGIGKIREFLLLVTRTLALLSLLILATAPELLTFLAADGFRYGLPAIYPLEIAVILSFISGAIISACAYYERGGITALPSIVSATVSVLLSFIILPRVDYRFAGVFALICYAIMTLLASLVFKRLSGEYPINLKKGAIILLLTMAYATVLYIFRDVLLSRIFLSLPLIPLLLFCAKEIWVKIKE
jgi:O-antigen/teichoic acid export membrane protein